METTPLGFTSITCAKSSISPTQGDLHVTKHVTVAYNVSYGIEIKWLQSVEVVVLYMQKRT